MRFQVSLKPWASESSVPAGRGWATYGAALVPVPLAGVSREPALFLVSPPLHNPTPPKKEARRPAWANLSPHRSHVAVVHLWRFYLIVEAEA